MLVREIGSSIEKSGVKLQVKQIQGKQGLVRDIGRRDPVINQPKPENGVNEIATTPEKPIVDQPEPVKPVSNNNKP
ncbi:hypothetical protein AWC38_SpisGene20351 [Stylophora pistillata]|uniref:Uncharacterized protein n=1 Tax=Stylophora pistillata TaxID=50429 RepID=A0A2B4RE54_STYPI|nr:hypothetical protein AWC38_SpisGene20351 [Stylophora pistillata]